MAIRIDAHVHLGTTGNKPKQTGAQLIAKMDEVKVDKAVVFPFTEGTFTNDEVQAFAEENPHRLIPFCSVNPFNGEAAYIELEDCLANRGFKGMKMHPAGLGYRLSDRKRTDPIFDILVRHDCPAIVHGASDLLNCPLEFDRVCSRFPTLKLIMAHSGYFWEVDQAIELAGENENLYLEVSRIPLFEIGAILKDLPPEKVIWGTDAPFADYAAEFGKMKRALPEPRAYDLVMGGNMARLLGL